MTLEQRIERLERQNRWSRRVAALALGALGITLLVGQGKEPDKVVAKTISCNKIMTRHLSVVDDDNKPLVTIAPGKEGGAGILLLQPDGTPRARLSIQKDGIPALSLYRGGGVVAIFDEANKQRATLGTTYVSFKDAEDKFVWFAPPKKK